jgi:hypothetical protein
MFLFRRAFAVLTATTLLSATLACGVSYAAKSKARVSVKPARRASAGQGRVSVPANMLKGSAVASGRAFYRTDIPENTLAGIRLGRKANEILAKWGNPTRITIGTATSEGAASAQSSGPAYTPPPANPYAALSGMLGGGMPSMMPPMMPGLGAPGQPSPSPDQQANGGGAPTLTQEEVTWTYDLTGGITLEFIITDGQITQITVGGNGPWGLSKTRSGLQLGDSYKLVLWVSGYPEKQTYAGRFLRTSYVEKSRALYTFLNRKMVGVTIALVQDELAGK